MSKNLLCFTNIQRILNHMFLQKQFGLNVFNKILLKSSENGGDCREEKEDGLILILLVMMFLEDTIATTGLNTFFVMKTKLMTPN